MTDSSSLADTATAARLYDQLVHSKTYNRIAWNTDPADYAAFAATAIGSARGPILEVAAGATTETLPLYIAAGRPTTITDRSPAMLTISQCHAQQHWTSKQLNHITWTPADMWDLPANPVHDTVLALGLLHLLDDPASLLDRLLEQCSPTGSVWATSLVAETRRARSYLNLLHRAGETAPPRTSAELAATLPPNATITTRGCMAYITLTH